MVPKLFQLSGLKNFETLRDVSVYVRYFDEFARDGWWWCVDNNGCVCFSKDIYDKTNSRNGIIVVTFKGDGIVTMDQKFLENGNMIDGEHELLDDHWFIGEGSRRKLQEKFEALIDKLTYQKQ